MPAPVTVILSSRWNINRRGIKYYLSDKPAIRVIGETESGETLLEILKNVYPDCIILDYRLSGAMDGLETLAAIKEKYPHIIVIIHTLMPDPEIIKKGMELGASAWLIVGDGTYKIESTILKYCKQESEI